MNSLWKRIVATFYYFLSRCDGEPIIELVVTPKAADWHKFKRVEYPVHPLSSGPFEPGSTFDISHKDVIVNHLPNPSYTPPIRIAHKGGRTVSDVRIHIFTVDALTTYVHGSTDYPVEYVIEFRPIPSLSKDTLVEPITFAYSRITGVPFEKQTYAREMSSEVSVSDVLDTALNRVFKSLSERRAGHEYPWKPDEPNERTLKLSYRDGCRKVSQEFTLRFQGKGHAGKVAIVPKEVQQ